MAKPLDETFTHVLKLYGIDPMNVPEDGTLTLRTREATSSSSPETTTAEQSSTTTGPNCSASSSPTRRRSSGTRTTTHTSSSLPDDPEEARMAHLDLTDTDGRHHRFNNPEVRILRKAARHIAEDGTQVVYDGTWIIEVTTSPDGEGVHQTEWVDGAEPPDYNHVHVKFTS